MAPDEPSFGWKLLNSWWVLITVFGVGCLSGAGFLYVGLRAKRPAWWIPGIVYFVLTWAGVYGIAHYPHGSTGLETVGMAYYGVWFASIVHALIINPAWLRWLAASRPRRAPVALAPPPVFQQPPVFQAQAGPPPVVAQAIDVNLASAEQLAVHLDPARAQRVVADRESRGGFQSVEEFAAAAGLMPHEFARLRPLLTCTPRPRAPQDGGGGRVLDF
ncbi:ComEA family DNA-binding protein [Dactylosporangium sp. CA-139066]|uniref:ComEA family DNA-binding protein n=1 Tax=Dactylosporangium sp. CA-139066 TaxID=3239930 RepID=UPI003D9433B3